MQSTIANVQFFTNWLQQHCSGFHCHQSLRSWVGSLFPSSKLLYLQQSHIKLCSHRSVLKIVCQSLHKLDCLCARWGSQCSAGVFVDCRIAERFDNSDWLRLHRRFCDYIPLLQRPIFKNKRNSFLFYNKKN